MGVNDLISQEAFAIKKTLQQSYYVQKLLDADIDKRDELRSIMEKVNSPWSAVPSSGGGGGDKIANALGMLEELERQISADIKRLSDVLTVNRMLIDSLDNYNHRIVLTKRYVNFEPWPVIAREMHYDRATIIRISQAALECLAKKKNKRCDEMSLSSCVIVRVEKFARAAKTKKLSGFFNATKGV